MEIPDSLMPFIQKHDAFLLRNHGALAVGCDLQRALFLMEEVEFNAKICKYARELGGVNEIPCEELEKLMEIRKKIGAPGKHPGCKNCKNLGTENCRCKHNCDHGASAAAKPANDADLVALITKKVMEALGK
jgi:L-fuculose-phosphate aldolase